MNHLKKILLAFMVVGSFTALASCNTFEGMGEDLQQGGEKLEKVSESRPDSVVASDKRITREIEREYAADSDLAGANISVSAYWGKVTLEGKLGSNNLEQRAISYARSVQGVKQVTSKITVTVS